MSSYIGLIPSITLLMKYIIISTIAALYFVLDPTPELYNSFCVALILLFGVPHGAADHRINATMNKGSNTALYIAKYVLIAGGYVVWWIFMPGKASIIFLILSSYHFGQEFLEDIKLSSIRTWEIMIWGTMLLIAPILIAYPEIRPNIEFVASAELPQISSPALIALVSAFLTVASVHLIYLLTRKRIDSKQFRLILVNMSVLVISFIFLPFIIAFTLYFILFHSMNALQHQYQWLKSKTAGYTIQGFIKDLLLFSFISIFGIVLLIIMVQPESLQEMMSYFFIMISVITLPHAILFDQFYKSRSNNAIH